MKQSIYGGKSKNPQSAAHEAVESQLRLLRTDLLGQPPSLIRAAFYNFNELKRKKTEENSCLHWYIAYRKEVKA